MSAPAPSDSVVDPVASNATQSGAAAAAASSTTIAPDASRREPPAPASGASQLTGQSLAGKTGDMEQTKQLVLKALQYHQDWPTPGINFIDILPIFRSPVLFATLIDVLVHQIQTVFPSNKPDVIVGLDARGFLFGPTLALHLGLPFVPVRKSGKMPGVCYTEVYQKEYGKDEFQIQADSLQKGQKVLVVDDILATGKFFTESSIYSSSSPFRFRSRSRCRSQPRSLPYSLPHRRTLILSSLPLPCENYYRPPRPYPILGPLLGVFAAHWQVRREPRRENERVCAQNAAGSCCTRASSPSLALPPWVSLAPRVTVAIPAQDFVPRNWLLDITPFGS